MRTLIKTAQRSNCGLHGLRIDLRVAEIGIQSEISSFQRPKPVACFDAECAHVTYSATGGYWFSAFELPT